MGLRDGDTPPGSVPVDARSAGPPLKAGVAGSDKCVFLVFILLNKKFPLFLALPAPKAPAPLPSRRVNPERASSCPVAGARAKAAAAAGHTQQ